MVYCIPRATIIPCMHIDRIAMPKYIGSQRTLTKALTHTHLLSTTLPKKREVCTLEIFRCAQPRGVLEDYRISLLPGTVIHPCRVRRSKNNLNSSNYTFCLLERSDLAAASAYHRLRKIQGPILKAHLGRFSNRPSSILGTYALTSKDSEYRLLEGR